MPPSLHLHILGNVTTIKLWRISKVIEDVWKNCLKYYCCLVIVTRPTSDAFVIFSQGKTEKSFLVANNAERNYKAG